MSRRGLTIIELMLSVSITMLVAGAIAAMLGAVSSGVGSRRDNRTTMLLANAAQSRLTAYIAPSRSVLDFGPGGVIIWFHDSRAGQTVHASEVRWLLYDPSDGTLSVYWVNFPDAWPQAAQDLEDQEHAAGSNWMAVLAAYQAKGQVSGQVLVDGIESFNVVSDQAVPADARHLMFEFEFGTQDEPLPVTVASTIRAHQPPTS